MSPASRTNRPPAQLHVEPLAPDRFRVSGGAEPHVIELLGQRVVCDCADYHYRRRICKHLYAVEEYLRAPTP